MNSANRSQHVELNSAEFARAVLAEHGLPVEPISLVSGWSNQVWIAPSHVVRVSSGRFRYAFLHEQRVIHALPDTVPHAAVRFHGQVGDQEWLIQDRIAGEPLRDVWLRLNEGQRQVAAQQLGTALKHLHSIPVSSSLRNPWLDEAISPGGQFKNAYHAPQESYQALLDAASHVPGVEQSFLRSICDFIKSRINAFARDVHVLVHGDLHFSNLLYDGEQLVAILDFEGARPAAPDQELDTLIRQIREPDLYWPPNILGLIAPEQLETFLDAFTTTYPELVSHSRLTERLQVYDALWHLVQLLHFPPGSGRPDPNGHLLALLSNT